MASQLSREEKELLIASLQDGVLLLQNDGASDFVSSTGNRKPWHYEDDVGRTTAYVGALRSLLARGFMRKSGPSGYTLTPLGQQEAMKLQNAPPAS